MQQFQTYAGLVVFFLYLAANARDRRAPEFGPALEVMLAGAAVVAGVGVIAASLRAAAAAGAEHAVVGGVATTWLGVAKIFSIVRRH
jgi:hypothetical protein